MFNLKGSIVALVTPMDSDGEINWQGLKDLIEWHIRSYTAGIVVVGTTGESATLDVSEHVQLIERSVDIVEGRIKVIAGTGANSTKEAVYLTNSAKSAGSDAALLVTPYYNKPTQEGLFRHYMQVADEVDLPQILYNVPSRTGCDLQNETVLRLIEHENIVGLKDATGDLKRQEDLLEELNKNRSEDFSLYSGDDPTATSFILNGGVGTISVTANIVPKIISEICELAFEGKSDEALDLDSKLKELNEILFIESNPIPIKWMLNRIGRITEGLRLPLCSLDEAHHFSAEKVLKDLKLLN
jgi:4-hydroxy-tetrahydrodipicolinate synthase|tara:strand:- start:1801 stop:2697 length:897 start_codon:yes stop_codon:yes gene_type:complete